MSPSIQDLLVNVQNSEQQIEDAKAEKTKRLEALMGVINQTVKLCGDIWEREKENTELQLKMLAQKHNFTFPRSDDKLNLRNLLNEVQGSFPIRNVQENSILEETPLCSDKWEIEDYSTEENIYLEIQPVDPYDRYHDPDPENNPYIFDYKFPIVEHKQLMMAKDKEKKVIVKQYFDSIVNKFLLEIEERILLKKKLDQSQIDKIDFNDPNVITAIKEKMNKKF